MINIGYDKYAIDMQSFQPFSDTFDVNKNKCPRAWGVPLQIDRGFMDFLRDNVNLFAHLFV